MPDHIMFHGQQSSFTDQFETRILGAWIVDGKFSLF